MKRRAYPFLHGVRLYREISSLWPEGACPYVAAPRGKLGDGRGLLALMLCCDVASDLLDAKSSALFQSLPCLISKQTPVRHLIPSFFLDQSPPLTFHNYVLLNFPTASLVLASLFLVLTKKFNSSIFGSTAGTECKRE